MQFTTDRYAYLDGWIRDLVQRHREFEDEPLHLALLYDPGRDTEDVFLFELLSNYGRDEVGEDGDLWEVTFASSGSLPLSTGQNFHLVLTNPRELEFALNAGWPTAVELRDAIRRGDFEVVYEDELGRKAIGWFG